MGRKHGSVAIGLLAATLVLGMLAACAPGGTAGVGGTLEVEFWSAPNQGQYNFWMKRAETFNQEGQIQNGKRIKVKVQMMPEAPSSEAGIQNALATNTAPAASENINRGFAATLAASGRIYDLTNLALFKDTVAARRMDTILPGWAINGSQYVIPVYANAMGYHWNAKALAALGFADRVPETLEDMRTLITSFESRRKTTMKSMGVSHLFMRPQLLRPEWWWDRWFDFQMQYNAFSQGGAWVDGNRLALDPRVTADVFQFFGMYGNALQTAEDWTAFEQAQVPVVFQVSAPWDIPKYQAAGKVYGHQGDYVYGPAIVRNRGDKPYTFADSKGIVFYKGENISRDEHEAIVSFIAWAFTGSNGVQTDIDWTKTTGMLPVRGDLLENTAFRELIDSNPAYGYQAAVMPYAIPAMAHEKMTEIQTVFGEKGLTPYIDSIRTQAPLTAGSATTFVEAAFAAMKASAGLE